MFEVIQSQLDSIAIANLIDNDQYEFVVENYLNGNTETYRAKNCNTEYSCVSIVTVCANEVEKDSFVKFEGRHYREGSSIYDNAFKALSKLSQ